MGRSGIGKVLEFKEIGVLWDHSLRLLISYQKVLIGIYFSDYIAI
jgi:hypothetical protein